MAKLSESEIQTALGTLPGWTLANGMIMKTYIMSGFPDAIALVNGAAEQAEDHEHHPDVDIRYNKVTFALVTHDAGGITAKDVELAHAIEEQANFIATTKD